MVHYIYFYFQSLDNVSFQRCFLLLFNFFKI